MGKNKSGKSALDCASVIDSRMERLHFFGLLKSLIVKIVLIAVAIFLVFTFLFGLFIQTGEGMYPRIRDGDLMLFFRHPTSYEIGDIVTLSRDGHRYTGRIVAKAGDTVDTSSEGKLVVNGAIQFEEIFYETYTQGSNLSYPYSVPENSYFILGDMRTGSLDSRDIGAAQRTELDGKLIAILRRRGL